MYFSTLCHGLEQQLKSSQYTDTTVTVGERTFDCRKVILSAMSPFFEAMYLSVMQESQNGVVMVK